MARVTTKAPNTMFAAHTTLRNILVRKVGSRTWEKMCLEHVFESW